MPVTTRSRTRPAFSTRPFNPPLYLPPDRFTRISSWVDDIEDCSKQNLLGAACKDLHLSQPEARILRRKRQHLAPISRNLCQPNGNDHCSLDGEPLAKKARMANPQEKQKKRGPGRPPKVPQSSEPEAGPSRPTKLALRALSSDPSLSEPQDTDLTTEKSTNTSNKTDGRGKKGQSVFASKKNTSIDIPYLESCKPSVVRMTVKNARAEAPLPPHVSHLFRLLNDCPTGVIPRELQKPYTDAFNTPRKSEDPPKASLFLDEHPYPLDKLDSLKNHLDKIVRDTEMDFNDEAHERQWAADSVVPLFRELETWPIGKGVRLLNVENCSIEPIELRLERPNGGKLVDEGSTSQNTSREAPQTASKMIDWSVGLILDNDTKKESQLLANAFRHVGDFEASLNQSMNYIRKYPLFLDIELKTPNSARTPAVQLAIWAAAGLSKKRFHGWDTSMPMPAIAINGHEWHYYLFFERDKRLIMMGPQRMGSTETLAGTYEIFFRLHQLIVWGTTTYRKWFEDEILTWCGKTAAVGGT